MLAAKGAYMIRYSQRRHTVWKRHHLADRFCMGGYGIELGASAHNAFDLPGSINVAPYHDDWNHPDNKDFQGYRQAQENIAGAYALIDIVAEAHRIPVPAGSQDYVISSHVFEHFPDPLSALNEWQRIVAVGGIIFITVPQREAHPSDVGRPLTTWEEVQSWAGLTVDDRPELRRGHYSVWTSESLQAIIKLAELPWVLEAVEDPDQKVGNGFTLVYRKA
jgi:SAM-dependent methyltransferase